MQLPDHIAATQALFRGEAERVEAPVQALIAELHMIVSGPWINTKVYDLNKFPHTALIMKDAGGTGSRANAPICDHRLAFICLAPDPHTAQRMATLARWILKHPDGCYGGWRAAGTTVIAASATAPTPYRDPSIKADHDGKWFTVDLSVLELVPA